jgi:hypothetical protein
VAVSNDAVIDIRDEINIKKARMRPRFFIAEIGGNYLDNHAAASVCRNNYADFFIHTF